MTLCSPSLARAPGGSQRGDRPIAADCAKSGTLKLLRAVELFQGRVPQMGCGLVLLGVRSLPGSFPGSFPSCICTTPAQAHGFIAWNFSLDPDSAWMAASLPALGAAMRTRQNASCRTRYFVHGKGQDNSEWRSSTTTTRKSPCVQRESLLENRGNRLHKAHLSAFVVLSRDSFAPVGPAKAFPATHRMQEMETFSARAGRAMMLVA